MMKTFVHVLLFGLVATATVKEIEEIEKEIRNFDEKVNQDINEDCLLPPKREITWCTVQHTEAQLIPHGESCLRESDGTQAWITCVDGTWLPQPTQQQGHQGRKRKKRSHIRRCVTIVRRSWWWYRSRTRCTQQNHKPTFTRCVPPTTNFYVPSGSTSMRLTWQEPTARDDEDGTLRPKRQRSKFVNGYARVGWWWFRRSQARYGYYPHYGETFTGTKAGKSYPITYVATDRNNQCVFCNFNVVVRTTHCTTLPRPTHGSVYCPPGIKAGDVCTFSCKTGYQTSVPRTTCQSDGTWSHGSSTVCIAIICSSQLPTFANGQYQCSSYSYGKSCHPSCNTGYTLTANYPITCRSSGWFKVDVSKCEDKHAPTLVGCPLDQTVTAGPQETSAVVTWSPPTATDNVVGTTVDITRIGISPGISQQEGSYTVKYQALDAADNPSYCSFTVTVSVTRCPQQSVTHGKYSCSHGTILGSECIWKCFHGYALQGSPTTTCGSSGSWTSSAPSCTVVICPPPSDFGNSVAHGSYSCPATIEFGSYCTSTCDNGFGQDIPSIAVCSVSDDNQPEYSIKTSPNCKDITPPSISNCNGPQTLSFTAEKSTTSAIVTWNPPVAVDNVDTDPVVSQESGPVSGSRVDTDDNAIVTWQATDAASNPSVLCTWLLEVDVIKCPVFIPPSNGHVECDHDYIYGSVCTLSCNTGFEVNGSATSECLESGTWSDQFACSVVTCEGPPSAFENGDYVCGDITYPYNSICSGDCNTGFELKYPVVSFCKGTRWENSTTPECLDIEPPTIENCQGAVTLTAEIRSESAIVQVTPPTATDNVDSSPTVSKISGPDNGASLNGTGIIKFQALDTAGNPSLVCFTIVTVHVIECPEIPWPASGSIAYSHNTVYGSTIIFNCEVGYSLSYSDTVTCGSDGTWSFDESVAPVCTVVECQAPTEVEHGYFTCPSLTYQSVCSFRCNSGFSTSNSVLATCQANRQWTYSSSPGCLDAQSPVITNCKSTQTFYADQGSESAAVTWQLPNVVDNYDTNVQLTQTSGNPVGSQLSVGGHIAEYTAIDAAGNEALVPCIINIVVEELFCTEPRLTYTDSNLNFSCPSFVWGETCNVSCSNTSSKTNSLSGPSSIVCDATSETTGLSSFWKTTDGSSPVCNEIVEPACALNLPVPMHGRMVYANEETLPIGFPTCEDDYDLPFGADTQLLCLDTGDWSGTVQDCTPLLHPSWAVLDASFRYTGTCASEESTNGIKDAVLAALEEYRGTNYAPACLDTNTCSYDDVTVVCQDSLKRETTITTKLRLSYHNTVNDASSFLVTSTGLDGMASALNNSIQDRGFNIVVDGVPLDVEPNSLSTATYLSLQCDEWRIQNGFKCRACGKGAYVNSNEDGTSLCHACPVGTYNDLEAAGSCTSCPAGHSTPSSGSKSVNNCTEQCPASHFSATGMKPCSPCQKGYYQPQRGQTSCLMCSPGTTTFSTISGCQVYDVVWDSVDQTVSAYSLSTQQETLSMSFWYQAGAGASLAISAIAADQPSSFFTVYLQNITGVSIEGTNIYVPAKYDVWTHIAITTSSSDVVSVYENEIVLSASLLGASLPVATEMTIHIDTDVLKAVRLHGLAVYDDVLDAVEIESLHSSCQPSVPGAVMTTDDLLHLPGITTEASNCIAVDPCASIPCGEGNSCSHTSTGEFSCTCLNDFSGPTCTIPPDYCNGMSCDNGGTCVSGTDGATCLCPDMYSGPTCALAPVNGGWSPWSQWSTCTASCSGGTMQRSRSCDSPAPTPTYGADCEGGTTHHQTCNEDACADINPCSNHPCGSGHQCVESSTGGWRCKCLHGYTGTMCETPPDSCYGHICQNGATCQLNEGETKGYVCQCPIGTTGEYCEYALTVRSFWTEWSTCSVSCDGGTSTRSRICDPNLETDFCTATAEKTCKTEACQQDHCLSSPCGSHTCISRGHTFTCLCNEGYTGPTCSEVICSCINGQCVTMPTGHLTCLCDAGYSGDLCEQTTASVDGNWGIWNEWSTCSVTCGEGQHQRSRSCDNPEPSGNGLDCVGDSVEDETCITQTCPGLCQCGELHDCIEEDSGYRCHCNHGYYGDQCQNPPDPCSPNPCLNGGDCSIVGTDFTCACVGGFSGELCVDEPVDSSWSAWEAWGDCSATCGGGVKQRSRICYQGSEGAPCQGSSSNSTACSEDACPECSALPKRYGMKKNCTTSNQTVTCLLECESGLKVANGSQLFTTYTCGPETAFEWNQIVPVPSCSPVATPKSDTGTATSPVSPSIPCSKQDQIIASVADKLSTTPCVSNSKCSVRVSLNGCGSTRRKRNVAESSTLDLSITVDISSEQLNNGTNETALLQQMDADASTTFETFVSDPDITVDGVTYTVDTANATTDGTVECQEGYSLDEEDDCVGCAPGSYYDSMDGFCIYCPEGTYQESSGQTECSSCEPGFVTNNTGSWQSSDCQELPPNPNEDSGESGPGPLFIGIAVGGSVVAIAVIVGVSVYIKKRFFTRRVNAGLGDTNVKEKFYRAQQATNETFFREDSTISSSGIGIFEKKAI